MLRAIGWTLALTGLLAAAGAALVVYGGLYHVGATRQHYQPVYSLLESAMHSSVRLRARDVAVPALDDARQVQRGAACFRARCVQCHGGPGLAPADFGKSMQPLPGPLVDARQRWQPRELYWITRHGIRMSGMPAWQHHLAEDEIWSLVAFLQVLPDLDPRAFAQATAAAAATAPACGEGPARDALAQRLPDAARGRTALYQYACSACHTVPGVANSSPQVGPPLAGIGARALIAGKLANTPENMVRWLRRPQAVDPLTAMPDMGVSEADAHDIAAYLATLR